MEWIRDELARRVHGAIGESRKDDVEAWWDTLPGKKKRRLIDILGLPSIAGKSFSRLDDAVRAEINAYFEKYDGIVESYQGGTDAF